MMKNITLFATVYDRLCCRSPQQTSEPWRRLGPAPEVVALTAVHKNLYGVSDKGRLWRRPAVSGRAPWEDVGPAPEVVALASSGSQLFAVTKDMKLLCRSNLLPGNRWHVLDASRPFMVVGMTASGDKIYAATADNHLWQREASVDSTPKWVHIGHANHVVSMTAFDKILYCYDMDNKMWQIDPTEGMPKNWTEIQGFPEIAPGVVLNFLALAAAETRSIADDKPSA